MLPANVTSFVIRHLAEGSNYVFQVRAIAPQGAGRLAEILLKTPLRPDPLRRKKSKPSTKDAGHAADAPPKSIEAAGGTSAARGAKVATASSDFTTSNYSILNNLDPEKLKMVVSRKSEPPIEKPAGDGAGFSPASSSSLSMYGAWSSAFFILPWLVVNVV